MSARYLRRDGLLVCLVTTPEQVQENAKAAGMRLDPEVLRRIDDVLSPVIQRDPSRTTSPATRP